MVFGEEYRASVFSLCSLLHSPVRIRGCCDRFATLLILYCDELLAPRPTPKLEDHSLSAVRCCLFNIFAATLHIWKPFLHPQPEDASCHGDRDPFLKYSKQTESKEKRPQDDQDVFCHSASYRALVAYLCLQSEAPYFLSALTAVMSTPDICIATAER